MPFSVYFLQKDIGSDLNLKCISIMLAPIRKQIDNLFMCRFIANLITDKSNLHMISLQNGFISIWEGASAVREAMAGSDVTAVWIAQTLTDGTVYWYRVVYARAAIYMNCTFTVSGGGSCFVSFERKGPIRTVLFPNKTKYVTDCSLQVTKKDDWKTWPRNMHQGGLLFKVL